MANDKAFKVKNGLLAQRYLQSAGTESAGSVEYNLAVASYDGVSFSVAGQDTQPTGLFLKPDGTKMYVVGISSDYVNEYDLSIAWNISTASYLQNFYVGTQEATPQGLFFKPDGTQMYVVGATGDDVNEYSLSTPWDVSTASYVRLFSVAAQDIIPSDIFFKPDGTKMYICGASGIDILEYNLSTAWNISTASYSQNFVTSIYPYGLSFKPDGTGMYVLDTGSTDSIVEYALGTAWDISTASSVQTFSVAAQDTSASGMFFKSDGTKMYIVGYANDAVYQYSTGYYTQTLDLSTGTYFSFTPSGATTVSFTNPPASGVAYAFTLVIEAGTDTITWPSSVKWEGGTAPTIYDTDKNSFMFVTTDGGTTYYGKQTGVQLS